MSRHSGTDLGHHEAVSELLIMRHAKSSWSSGAARDFDRPLSPRGETDRWRMARWLTDHDLVPDRVISSSANRARATAEAVIEHCGIAEDLTTFDEYFYGIGSRGWMTELSRQSDPRVLICGHNPSLDMLVETLADSRPELADSGKLMTTSAIAHLRSDAPWGEAALNPGSWNLATIARPREI